MVRLSHMVLAMGDEKSLPCPNPIPLCFLVGLLHWRSFFLTSLGSLAWKAQISPFDLVWVILVARSWNPFWMAWMISGKPIKWKCLSLGRVGSQRLQGVPLISLSRGSNAWWLQGGSQRSAHLVFYHGFTVSRLGHHFLCLGFLNYTMRIIIAPISWDCYGK